MVRRLWGSRRKMPGSALRCDGHPGTPDRDPVWKHWGYAGGSTQDGCADCGIGKPGAGRRRPNSSGTWLGTTADWWETNQKKKWDKRISSWHSTHLLDIEKFELILKYEYVGSINIYNISTLLCSNDIIIAIVCWLNTGTRMHHMLWCQYVELIL